MVAVLAGCWCCLTACGGGMAVARDSDSCAVLAGCSELRWLAVALKWLVRYETTSKDGASGNNNAGLVR